MKAEFSWSGSRKGHAVAVSHHAVMLVTDGNSVQ